MSAAPAGLLPQLRNRLRAEVGPRAVECGRAFDEFVDAILRCWNLEHWQRLARDQPGSQISAVRDAKVLIAKVREDVEAMWGDSEQLQTLYRTVGRECMEAFLRFWFQCEQNRAWIRNAIRELRDP